LYAGPRSTSKSGILDVISVDAKASAARWSIDPEYSKPALKKYGDTLNESTRGRGRLRVRLHGRRHHM
jgi:hypothetical protein